MIDSKTKQANKLKLIVVAMTQAAMLLSSSVSYADGVRVSLSTQKTQGTQKTQEVQEVQETQATGKATVVNKAQATDVKATALAFDVAASDQKKTDAQSNKLTAKQSSADQSKLNSAKADQSKLKPATATDTSGGQIPKDILSNAFNMQGMGAVSVDPQTGVLNINFALAMIWGNGLQGGSSSLSMGYSGSGSVPAYAISNGFSLNLPYIDFDHRTIYLPGGGRYHINPDNTLEYAKLQDKQFSFVHNADGSFVFTDASGSESRFDQYGKLIEVVSALGYALHYNYSNGVLASISDDQGRSVVIDRSGLSVSSGKIRFISQGIAGNALVYTVNVANSRVVSVVNPLDEQTTISYSDDPSFPGLPNKVVVPTGASYAVSYKTILSLSGQPIPVVDKLTVSSNSSLLPWMTAGANALEPVITSEYFYTSSDNQHNYLGYGSGVSSSNPNQDPMLEAVEGNYFYQTKVQALNQYGSGQSYSINTYDHYHRLVDTKAYSAGNVLLSHSSYQYASDPDTPFSSLDGAYQEPTRQMNQAYGINDQGSVGASVPTFSTHEYDPDGLTTQSTSGYIDGDAQTGTPVVLTTQNTQYFSAKDAGPFRHLMQSQKVIPASLAGVDTPAITQVENTLARLSRTVDEHSYETAYIAQSTTLSNGVAQYVSSKTLMSNPDNPQFFGVLASESTALPSSLISQLPKGANQSVMTHYDYALTTQSGLTKASHVGNSGNSANSGIVKNASNITHGINTNAFADITIGSHDQSGEVNLKNGTQTLSAYSGQVKSITDILGNVETISYDDLGRVISKTWFANSTHPLTSHYSYEIDTSNNLLKITQIDPTGGEAVEYLDSLGRQVGVEASDINHTKLLPMSSTIYNDLGQVIQSNSFGSFDDKGTLSTLSTRYLYDDAGDKVASIHPDGSADIAVSDRARAQSIGYHLLSNGIKSDNQMSLCHLVDGTPSGCKVYSFSVVRNDIKAHRKDSFSLLADALAKRENGQFVYDRSHQSNLSSLESSLDNGNMIDAKALADFAAEVTGFSESGYNPSADESFKHVYSVLNSLGQVAYSVDDKGFKTSFKYDVKGNVIRKTSTATNSTQNFSYDLLTNLVTKVSLTDNATGKTTVLGTNDYNGLGQLLSYTNASGYPLVNQYDQNGFLVKSTNANGLSISKSYDSMGRVTDIKSPEDEIYYGYGNSNDPTQVTELKNSNSDVQMSYYADGSLQSQTISYPLSAQPTLISSWNNNAYGVLQSQSQKLGDVDSTTSYYLYDRLGRVFKVSDDQGHYIENQYDAQGQLNQAQNNQITTSYSYGDTRTGLPLLMGLSLSKTQDQTMIYRFGYQYNDDGNITEVTRPHTTYDYQYLPTGQLSQYRCNELSLPQRYCPMDEEGNHVLQQNFSYDVVWNNLLKVDESLVDKSGNSLNNSVSYTYDNNVNPVQLTSYGNTARGYIQKVSFSYDKEGNMLNDQGDNKLRYDSFDQLIQMTPSDQNAAQGMLNYRYDAMGQQISETQNNVNPLYFYYVGGSPVYETQNGHYTRYNSLGQVSDGSWQYYLSDEKGSLISTMNDTGQISGYHVYLPFGYGTDLAPVEGNPIDQVLDIKTLGKGYNGMLTDRVSQNQFLGNGYRAYNPLLRHFMKYDESSPFGAGGINGYQYAGNNPMMNVDPSGHDFWDFLKGVGIEVFNGTLTGLFGRMNSSGKVDGKAIWKGTYWARLGNMGVSTGTAGNVSMRDDGSFDTHASWKNTGEFAGNLATLGGYQLVKDAVNGNAEKAGEDYTQFVANVAMVGAGYTAKAGKVAAPEEDANSVSSGGDLGGDLGGGNTFQDSGGAGDNGDNGSGDDESSTYSLPLDPYTKPHLSDQIVSEKNSLLGDAQGQDSGTVENNYTFERKSEDELVHDNFIRLIKQHAKDQISQLPEDAPEFQKGFHIADNNVENGLNIIAKSFNYKDFNELLMKNKIPEDTYSGRIGWYKNDIIQFDDMSPVEIMKAIGLNNTYRTGGMILNENLLSKHGLSD